MYFYYRKDVFSVKILELTLTNFLPIISGIGKDCIHIDLRDSESTINVLIGKIGSGKTYILSHLQPFSTVGTLDVRNQDDPIVPEKDGQKIIMYEKDNHEYKITHDYIWSGKSHTKKSYIEKDGIELNENGNGSSFKEIIRLEFGIEQSFLRLIRLGPNVINFINMKATERKSFVASLLASTEIYLLLYKNWSSELRTLNTQASILMNKLNNIPYHDINELESQITEMQDTLCSLNGELTDFTKEKFALQAENKSYMDGKSLQELKIEETQLKNHIDKMKDEVILLENQLAVFQTYPNINDVSKEIGKLDQMLSSTTEKLTLYNSEYDEISKNLNIAIDRKTTMENDSHMKTLHETYDMLISQSEIYKKELHEFNCQYSSKFLSTLLGDLNTVNILISEIGQYDTDIVKTLCNSDASAIQYAKKKVDILTYRKIKVQKEMSNLKFSETYQVTSPLYFPPFCPTSSCPYYRTHPETLKRSTHGKNAVQEQLVLYQNELKDLDIEIYRYSDYPIIYHKIQNVKEMLDKMIPVLNKIGALKCGSLVTILTLANYRVWYDYDKIVDTIDLLEKREKYADLISQIKIIKSEIDELDMQDISSISNEISVLSVKKKEKEVEIQNTEKAYLELESSLKKYNRMYVELSEKSIHETNLKNAKETISNMVNRIDMLQKAFDMIDMNASKIQLLDTKSIELKAKIDELSSKLDEHKTILHDMKYTNNELTNVLEEQKYMSYMVDAVSSKKGIPLIMIQMFLDQCREMVNDLIFNICEDDLEILPFDINETEFKIPYMVNGQKIDDISKASQGQSSIVSTAMSFALARQTGSSVYNIPLLDEMDAPLHKSDKQRFIAILLKHLSEIGSEQCFVITHDDNTFDGYPVQVIMTTNENVNTDKYTNIIRL